MRPQMHFFPIFSREQREKEGRPFSTPWQILIGLVALLDYLSTLANRRLFKDSTHNTTDNQNADNSRSTETLLYHFRLFSQNYGLPHEVFSKLFLWLDAYSIHFGVLFSLLWCLEAFRIADRMAEKALSEWDRRDRLSQVVGHLQRLRSRSTLQRLRIRSTTSTPTSPTTSTIRSYDYERYKTYFVYYTALMIQFLFLPVGFYLFLYQLICTCTRMHIPSTPQEQQDMQHLLHDTYTGLDETTPAIFPGQYRTFSNETKLSLGFAIAKHSGAVLYQTAQSNLKRKLWWEGRKLTWTFIRHPVQSFHKTKGVLYWIRWIKYLLPLLRRMFNLRNNILWLYCTWRQRRDQKIAELQRRRAWRLMNQQQKLDRAAQTIQSTYRSYQERQAALCILQSRQENDDIAARRIQEWCVKVILDRHKEKKAELKRLEARLIQRTKQKLDEKERKRLEELRKQYNQYSIDRRLLMRPDTKFQALWKSLFVGITFLQIIGYGLNQKFKKEQSSLTAKIEELLVRPESSVLELKECACLAKARGDPIKWQQLYQMRNKKCREEPWYCTPDYLQRQTMYANGVTLAMELVLFLASLAAFLDVPVFFYTGVYHPETGELVPKNFFGRWIFPGLLLQLLVNTHMEPASKIFFKLFKSSYQIGPIRVLRWCRVLFYPLASWTFVFLETHVWMPLVSFTNREPTVPEQDEVVSPKRRRSSIDMKRVSMYLKPGPPRRASIFSNTNAAGPYYHHNSPSRLSYGRISRSTSIATLNISPRRISATKKFV